MLTKQGNGKPFPAIPLSIIKRNAMTKDEAYILLSFHSCRNNDIENEKWENGFLGSLRPFRGELYENNFIEIMECLKVLADDFMQPIVNQTLISDVYSIIHLGRRWIVGADFVTQEQQKQIIEMVDIIQDCFYYLLEGDVDTAFLEYEEYKEYKIDNKES